MLIELQLNWTFLTTPSNPQAVTAYWRVAGSTGAYTPSSISNGQDGSMTITTLNDTSSTITTACTLQYEGYIIPDCFIGTATDCSPFLYSHDGLESPNPACTYTDRIYWTASIDATDKQGCRGVSVSCTKSGVLSARISNPANMKLATWDDVPNIIVTDSNTGSGFNAIPHFMVGPGGIINLTENCFTVTPGSLYSYAPTAVLETSNEGYIFALELTMGCQTFTYSNCKSAPKNSGNILLGDSNVICMLDSAYDAFAPVASSSTFEKSKLGCCTGNGRKYRLTWSNPSPSLYPGVTIAFSLANTTNPGDQQFYTITNSTPYVITCCAEDSIVAYRSPTGNITCSTDRETNAWLFDHLLIEDLGPC